MRQVLISLTGGAHSSRPGFCLRLQLVQIWPVRILVDCECVWSPACRRLFIIDGLTVGLYSRDYPGCAASLCACNTGLRDVFLGEVTASGILPRAGLLSPSVAEVLPTGLSFVLVVLQTDAHSLREVCCNVFVAQIGVPAVVAFMSCAARHVLQFSGFDEWFVNHTLPPCTQSPT